MVETKPFLLDAITEGERAVDKAASSVHLTHHHISSSNSPFSFSSLLYLIIDLILLAYLFFINFIFLSISIRSN